MHSDLLFWSEFSGNPFVPQILLNDSCGLKEHGHHVQWLSFRCLFTINILPTHIPFIREMVKDASFRRFIIVDDSTIRETRDHQEEKRPRKRARVDSDDEEEPKTTKNIASGWSSLNPSDKPGEHDSLYYLDDPTATCIFRVGDVLFKVSFSSFFFFSFISVLMMITLWGKIHQEIFECSEFMKDLLKDHLSHTNGSTSDDNPLLFRLATPEESRAFLWALYAKYVPLPSP